MENNVSAILEGLNEEQRRAVENVDGPVLIVAGAGSGKTRVLTSRIAYILARGVESERIMALTFTKKAASEMKERISLMVGRRAARGLYMGTFHSIFIRFLRKYSASLGYPENFTIYDTSDSQSAIKACLKEMGLDDKVYKPRSVQARISMAKNNLVTPGAYRKDLNAMRDDAHSKMPRLCEVYALYAQKCKQSGAMDFDDILLNMNILLRDNPDALREISGQFSYILVDEYQDTNEAQYKILRKLSMGHQNICVVGDDSQSIYAFRGAKIQNILNFKKDFPTCKIFRLERNYRSTQVIVNAANSLIEKNSGRIPKDCYSMGEDGKKIVILRATHEKEEANRVVSDIIRKMSEYSAQYQDFAILYRTNAQSRALEEALRLRNIPYIIYSGNSFFERAEVKDMMAYFKLCVNPLDEESFKRVVNKPARGIGDTSIDYLIQAARALQTSLFKATFAEGLEQYGLKPAAIKKLREFCEMINAMAMELPVTDAHEMAKKIADKSGLYAFYKSDTSIEGQSRTANVEELVSSVLSYVQEKQNEIIEEQELDPDLDELPLVTLDAFLENVTLLSNIDMEDEEDTNNKVALMTVHSSKGLEFPHVYITGLEEELFPSGGYGAPGDIEEERRLFYVALTRAKKTVDLAFADSRMINGKTKDNTPSRFIKEIDSQYFENPLKDGFEALMGSRFGSRPQQPYGTVGQRGAQASSTFRRPQAQTAPVARPAQPARPASVPRSATPPPVRFDPATFVPDLIGDFREGQVIEHNRFGRGLITSISGKIPELKAIIKFDEYPEPKTILLKFAKMRIIK
ncbi:MAG: UvrD-helicase domain-containing protein [Bacteroidales bacterium]|nr:UvrD-helicase domain-containing protein [Bacteroidales bacterium]